MGGFENSFNPIATFDYSEIPNFIKPAVQGHTGTLTFVEVEGKITAILSGRAHYYERGMIFMTLYYPLGS
ncbi:MAG: hypothetical protein Ct9H90mP10_06370 [Actinomycetota bacterium]|nr:MAG: hypothetical protein Ct9H90mP10_06370 [Actinomycetota bacterium]